jgi:hypothetical protein
MSHRDEYEVLESGILEPLPDDTVQSFESYDVVPVAPIVTRELSKIVFHETTKHLGSVLDYLAILAWNRVVMRVVGGPTRTTIDVLMTRQFHGLQLVWTWVYTVWVSSVCVATVRWSVGKRLRLEDEERRIENRRTTPLFSRRFVAFTHRRLAGACTYVAMWAWAVALLGSGKYFPFTIFRLPDCPYETDISFLSYQVVYAGGGCLDAAPELKEFIELTGIPVTNTLMGLGCYPASDPLSLHMLGMHGAVYANYAIDSADLLLAFGVRFDDRVTGKLEAFAARASIVHIDIDPAEIGKNKHAHAAIFSNIKPALRTLNGLIRGEKATFDFSEWLAAINVQRAKFPFSYSNTSDYIVPQYAVELLCKMTDGKAIVSTGVGQHQMWAAQHYKFDEPRNWLTSGGLGSMGFGLPAAIGACAARPDAVVIDIDGDGSFVMNIQELATLHAENLPVKMFILNNQHLGMVVQWEDRFYGANRGHTYLGSPDVEYHTTKNEADIFPDFVKICEGFRVPAERVVRKEDLGPAIQRMLDHDGPYLLDVMFPHQEHVLPMVPGGGTFKDTITTGDGRTPELKDMNTL